MLTTIAADKQCELTFDDVRLPASALLGREGEGWAVLRPTLRRATVASCAYLVGLAQRDLEISLEYAKERTQFDRPIGAFQAIQHKAADMATDVDTSRFMTYRAAWAVSHEAPDQDRWVSMAKAWCSDASRRVVAHGQQIHAGIGFTKEYIIQCTSAARRWRSCCGATPPPSARRWRSRWGSNGRPADAAGLLGAGSPAP